MLRRYARCLPAFAFIAAMPVVSRAQTAPQGVPVTVATVAAADVPVMLSNIGTVQSLASVLVRARVDGTLDKVAFTEGQDVKAGDLLAQIDPRPYAAAYAQAAAKKAADEAQLANARHDLTRYSNLAKSDFASRQSVDTQAASVAQLEANVAGDDAAIQSAKLNLDYAAITSPIDGRVGLRLVDPGNLIHASDSTGIVTVTQIKPISVIFTLPQDSLPAVQAAMARGKLSVVTGTFRLKAVFPNQDERLWPGQFVNAHLQVEELHNATVVPTTALEHGPNGTFVYLVKPDQTVAVQPVDVRLDNGKIAVIAKGLDAGATVVVDGQSRLQDGTRISAAPHAAS
jgi:multidrug efflux system membrane fusion protein